MILLRVVLNRGLRHWALEQLSSAMMLIIFPSQRIQTIFTGMFVSLILLNKGQQD